MNAEVREAISTAVNTVDGITCTPYFRQATKPGSALVRLERSVRDTSGFSFMNTWQVVLLLPQDIATAEKYLDAKVTALVTAISEELVVTSITPQELRLDGGINLPCVVIEGNRASD